jgi:putative transposase
MARLPRLSAAGHTHLVVQRGHNRQPVAVDDIDRRNYLDALRESAASQAVAVHAYALLDSDVLLLVTPAHAQALGRMMQALGRRYVSAFNRRHGRTGTLWEGRFRNTIIESERFFLACLRHVELAPVRHALAFDAADYGWSSARHHLGHRRDPLVTDHPLYWTLGNTPFERELAYRHWLEQGEPLSEAAAIADAAAKGLALGSEPFKVELTQATGRPPSPRPRGRPRQS